MVCGDCNEAFRRWARDGSVCQVLSGGARSGKVTPNAGSLQIADISEVKHLAQLPALRVLWLIDNPCAAAPDYHERVTALLPSLQKLDGIEVGRAELPSRSASEVRRTSASQAATSSGTGADASHGPAHQAPANGGAAGDQTAEMPRAGKWGSCDDAALQGHLAALHTGNRNASSAQAAMLADRNASSATSDGQNAISSLQGAQRQTQSREGHVEAAALQLVAALSDACDSAALQRLGKACDDALRQVRLQDGA